MPDKIILSIRKKYVFNAYANIRILAQYGNLGRKMNEIPEFITKLPKLTKIYLIDVPLKIPPIDVTSNGMEAIRNYYNKGK